MKSHLLAAVAVGAVLVAGSANAQQIRLMTGPQGGSWYPLGGAIQNIVENSIDGASVQVLPGAGIANVKAVEAGKAHNSRLTMGCSQSTSSTAEADAAAADRETPAEPSFSDLLREAADREAGAPPPPPAAERSLSDLLREAAGR